VTHDAVPPPAPVISGSAGILGGTFDPIHHGHLAIAEEVRERLGLERVLFVPSRVPPHRPVAPGASAEDRFAMVELAIAANPAFAVSRIELDRPGPSYSVDTVAGLVEQARAAGREADLWFIASTEAVRALPTWRQPERLLAMTRFAVVPRAGSEPLDEAWLTARLPGAAGRLALLDGPLLPISGTALRARAAVGRSLRYLVPEAVARYIGDHRLYRQEAAPAPEPAQETHRP
jgi:nicotinate-nucleotide adenylyltransferase